MTLINNGCRIMPNWRFHGAFTAGVGGSGVTIMDPWSKQNFDLGEARVADQSVKSGQPNGVRPSVAWRMPRVAGAMKSYGDKHVRIDGAASGALGQNMVAAATIQIDGQAFGGLIVSAQATATIAILGVADVSGSITTTASGSIRILGTADIGAIGHLIAAGQLQILGSADLMAIGHMVATTIRPEMTPEGIALAVWRALASENNLPGTMGEKVNSAGSAGNPWTEILEDGMSAAEVLRILLAVAAGDAVVPNGDGTYRFKSADGAKTRIEGTISGSDRTVTTKDGT